MVRDPVSGVWFDVRTAVATREHGGNLLYFASQESVDLFDDDPHYYGHPDPEEEHTGTQHEHPTH
ncbi:MAG: hypothetical protein IAE80_00915 [Anaerolinea sp.]|nr:hypothetical protein [Anaerolinea sp.]